MSDTESFRRRLIDAGVDLPPALVELIAGAVAPMIAGLDELARLDLGTCEPFDPARALADDAVR